MRSFLTALKFLTVFPWPRQMPTTPAEIGRSAPLFPLVGLCLGMILALVNQLLAPYLPTKVLSILLITLLILMTRALHLDGLGDSFDGLGAKGGRDNALQVMGDSRIGTFGLLAVMVVILFKVGSLEVMGEERYHALLLAPVLGRWAMVGLACGSPSARDGLGRIMVEHVKVRHLLLASGITLVVLVPLAGLTGLGIALGVSLFTWMSRSYLYFRLGGVTGDTFGAVGELTETLTFVIFASVLFE